MIICLCSAKAICQEKPSPWFYAACRSGIIGITPRCGQRKPDVHLTPPGEAMHSDELNTHHGIEQQLMFITGEHDVTLINISNAHATATIRLQGAQVISWKPLREEKVGVKASEADTPDYHDEVIWVSEQADFTPGKSVRGGIPICWPWFGAHKTEKDYPAHGFARTVLWQINSTQTLDDGSTRVSFTLEPDADTAAMWPPQTSVLLHITVGRKLELELVTHNNGEAAINISQAFHTYFNVGDVRQAQLHGLEDTDYLDKLDGFSRKHQHGMITVNEEVDRVYLNTATDCVLEDRSLQRNIIIIKCGSHSTVVWNPWRQTAEKMGDL
ncbi:MAG TPA: D-hexose-6-phosphate mutarotase, partial [Thiotrichales bacterium]|nr:D-hexose-6-phosphate mutarotase [Thiotrichales bacterium]